MIGRGGIRTRLLLASTVAVAIALILVVGGFNLVLRHELSILRRQWFKLWTTYSE